MPTKDELETENAELRARVAELEETAVSRETSPQRPERPRELSAGEADDLRQFGVCISPFDGATLNVLDFPTIEPANPDARKNAERHAANRNDAQVIVDVQRAKALSAGMVDVSRETTTEDPAGQ